MNETVAAIIEKIKSAKHCTAFTGAGISTLSGIPDFRGKNGLSKKLDTDRIFDFNFFRKEPEFFYREARNFIYNMDSIKPSLVHTGLAKLEDIGIIKGVVTQNIDMLHNKAGSKNVMELHGSPRVHYCLDCGQKFSYDEVLELLTSDIIPECVLCGGIIKPAIVFYGEQLSELELVKATDLCGASDLLLILGSSLLVQPAASLPLETIYNDGSLIIINEMQTPLDQYAALRYPDLEEVFQAIADTF